MRHLWKRRGSFSDLERQLRRQRPQPAPELVDDVLHRVAAGERSRGRPVRLAFSAGLSILAFSAVAFAGGLGYAGAGAEEAFDGVKTALQLGPTQQNNSPSDAQYYGARCGQDEPDEQNKPPDPEKHARCPMQAGDKKDKEGNSGSTPFTFVVSIAGGLIPTAPVSVGYVTNAGTASAVSDFTPAAGIVTFGAGETVKTVTVQVAGDLAREANETFSLTLVNPSPNAEIVDGEGVGTIANDDR